MKTKQIFFFLLFTCSLICYSQTVKGIYTIQPLKGVGDTSELSERAKKPLYFSYTYAKNKSLQELIEGGGTFIDTIYNEYKEVPGEKFASKSVTNRPKKGFYYKDFTSSNYRVYSEKNNIEIYVSDNLPTYEWKLENESKTISGYNCKKATTIKKSLSRTINIVAWYCEDIAINDGPLDFSGLPGFIIQIENNDTTIIKFEKIKIISNTTTEIVLPEIASKPITIKEYETNTLNGK
ncbi:GLPGLI family protein [Flavobacterium sasangense]|uniref:GLPGLI family protein n=1 Tax=Flavobacterium sasangense TaxID=503361 RepID=UPI00047DDF61|nr:GLPGLI family protein [Flavobacterium sasangense]